MNACANNGVNEDVDEPQPVSVSTDFDNLSKQLLPEPKFMKTKYHK